MRGGVELHGSGCKIPVEGEGEILWHRSSGSRTGIKCESIRYRQRESGPFRDYFLAVRSAASVGPVYMIGHQRIGRYWSEKNNTISENEEYLTLGRHNALSHRFARHRSLCRRISAPQDAC